MRKTITKHHSRRRGIDAIHSRSIAGYLPDQRTCGFDQAAGNSCKHRALHRLPDGSAFPVVQITKAKINTWDFCQT